MRLGRENSAEASATAAAAARKSSAKSVHAAPGPKRDVWDNPILWRELCTWAYGRKVIFIKVAYLLMAAAAAYAVYRMIFSPNGLDKSSATSILAPLSAISLFLINALSVTALTNERDGRAIDLLLVTDLRPSEFVFGKLWGAIYNTREMVLAPPAVAAYIWAQGAVSGENAVLLIGGYLVLAFFSAVLGLHCGMTYLGSRSAILVSLGVLFFLFVGVAVCMQVIGLVPRVVSSADAAVFAVADWRLCRPVCVVGHPQPESGDRHGVIDYAISHLLGAGQFPARHHAGRVSSNRGQLSLLHRSSPGAGSVRIRCGHRPDLGRRLTN